ncbi:MAG TPA: hypothetical protein VGM51_00625 [Armatimonadota bacterium]|jgi:hypothetical protein
MSVPSVFVMSAISAALFVSPSVRAQPSTGVDAASLVRSADFVGVVLAQVTTTDLVAGEQGVQLYRVDPIKGRIPKTNGTPPYPWVSGKSTRNPSRPTQYVAKGYYLVFLQRGSELTGNRWPTLACYRIEYRPDASGRIVGRLAGLPQPAANADLATVRGLLKLVIAGGPSAAAAAVKLNATLESAALASHQEPKTHEEQIALAKPLAASIRVGTLRSDVEKVFLQQDGGLSGPRETRYYMGYEVMVAVPYDQTGGNWKPTNRVTGPLRVYRSGMAFD